MQQRMLQYIVCALTPKTLPCPLHGRQPHSLLAFLVSFDEIYQESAGQGVLFWKSIGFLCLTSCLTWLKIDYSCIYGTSGGITSSTFCNRLRWPYRSRAAGGSKLLEKSSCAALYLRRGSQSHVHWINQRVTPHSWGNFFLQSKNTAWKDRLWYRFTHFYASSYNGLIAAPLWPEEGKHPPQLQLVRSHRVVCHLNLLTVWSAQVEFHPPPLSAWLDTTKV